MECIHQPAGSDDTEPHAGLRFVSALKDGIKVGDPWPLVAHTNAEGLIYRELYLAAAGILEIAWAYAMKQSHGFTRPVPTLIMIVTMIGSFGLLSVSMRTLPLGTAYMIWTGIGAVGAFLVGITLLGEAVSPARVAAAKYSSTCPVS